jgi:hypothetical protein
VCVFVCLCVFVFLCLCVYMCPCAGEKIWSRGFGLLCECEDLRGAAMHSSRSDFAGPGLPPHRHIPPGSFKRQREKRVVDGGERERGEGAKWKPSQATSTAARMKRPRNICPLRLGRDSMSDHVVIRAISFRSLALSFSETSGELCHQQIFVTQSVGLIIWSTK